MLERLARYDDLWDGDLFAAVSARGVKVLLIRLGQQVVAYEDRCPHLGAALSRGRLRDGVLTCSAHEWVFDAESGVGVNPKIACLRGFPVEIIDGEVLCDLPERAATLLGRTSLRNSGAAARASAVGPVLEAGAAAAAVLAAIRALNAEVAVEDRGSYLRVGVRDRCVVTRAAIEAQLGKAFRLPVDLEAIMPSFVGALTVNEEEASWQHP